MIKKPEASLLASLSLLALTAPLSADDKISSSENEKGKETAIETISVVGSQLKGLRFQAVPVTVLSHDQLSATGLLTGDDLLRSLPEAGYVSFQDQNSVGGVNSVRGDAASINLRGLGTGNSLMLINGRRMVNHASFQTEFLVPVMSPNSNDLPVNAIASLEILRGGASALYGSDAVAGVVNSVLDSDYRGLSVTGRFGLSDKTSMTDSHFGLKYGADVGNGGVTIFATYARRTAVRTSERAYAASSDLRPLLEGTDFEGDSNFNNSSNRTPWGEFEAVGAGQLTTTSGTQLTNSSGRFYLEPCESGACITPTNPGSRLYSDWMSGWTLIPARDRLSLYSMMDQKLSDSIELYAEAGYSWSKSSRNREPSAIISSHRILVPASNYWNPFGAATLDNGDVNPNRRTDVPLPDAGYDILLRSYRVVDAGERLIDVTSDTFRLLSGLRGDLSGGWAFDTAFLYAQSTTLDVTHNRISNSLFQQALALNTPDAYNPFNGADPLNPQIGDTTPNSAATLNSFLIDVTRRGKTTLTLADVKLYTDALVTLPAGKVGLAFGAEWRRESFVDDRDDRLDGTIPFVDQVRGALYGSDVMNSSPTADTQGSRRVKSVFAEVNLPLLSSDMDIPLVQEFTVNIAARYEDFSDVGDSFKPKLSAYWSLGAGFTLRGAWSQGFRAPNLVQIKDAGVSRVNSRIDYLVCQAQVEKGLVASLGDCASSGVESIRSGSETLKPEQSTHTTLGLVWQPKALSGLRLSVDYFHISQQGLVGVFGDQNHLALDLLLRQSGGSNPNVIRRAPDAVDTALFDGTTLSPAGEVLYVADQYSNLDNRTVKGMDFTLSYQRATDLFGMVSARLSLSHLMKFNQQAGASGQLLLTAVEQGLLPTSVAPSGFGELSGQNILPRWRASGSIGFEKGPWAGSLFVTHIGPTQDSSATQDQSGAYYQVESWTVTNLSASYAFSQSDWRSGMKVTLGATNLFDVDPPLADEDFGFFGSLHSPMGRVITLSLQKDF